MDIRTARLIREIKRRCTYRRLAEIYYEPNENEYGNQIFGTDLCYEACAALGIDWMKPYMIGKDQDFDKENVSYLGNFYWWE